MTFAAPLPIKFAFDPVNDAMLLKLAGYTCVSYDAEWVDVGGPESGPRLQGHPAFDVWTLETPDGTHEIIVENGEVVDYGDSTDYDNSF